MEKEEKSGRRRKGKKKGKLKGMERLGVRRRSTLSLL